MARELNHLNLVQCIINHGKWPTFTSKGVITTPQEASGLLQRIKQSIFATNNSFSESTIDSLGSMLANKCHESPPPDLSIWVPVAVSLLETSPIDARYLMGLLGKLHEDGTGTRNHFVKVVCKIKDGELLCQLLGQDPVSSLNIWVNRWRSNDPLVPGLEFVEDILSRQPILSSSTMINVFEEITDNFGVAETVKMLNIYPHISANDLTIVASIPLCIGYRTKANMTPLRALHAPFEYGIGIDEFAQLCIQSPEHQWTGTKLPKTSADVMSDVTFIKESRKCVIDAISQHIKVRGIVGVVSEFIFSKLKQP